MQKHDANRSPIKPSLSQVQRQQILNRSRLLIAQLTDPQVLKGRQVQLTELDITNICTLLNEQLMEEPSCLHVQVDTKLYILGDLHGHFTRLLQILHGLGPPPNVSYLFLGNYVSRGEKSTETIVLLFAYKLLYPKSIHLLRGNHESDQLGRRYGFYAECTRRFTVRLWRILMMTFNHLPAAALIENGIFCSHSGISPSLIYSGVTGSVGLKDYLNTWIVRPTEIEANMLLTQLVWSEPDPHVTQWERNPAGLGYLFGPRQVEQFCDQFNLQKIFRSNMLIQNGYTIFAGTQLVSICSQPDFLGLYQNAGAVVELRKSDKHKAIVCQIRHLSTAVPNRAKSEGRSALVIESTQATRPMLGKSMSQDEDST